MGEPTQTQPHASRSEDTVVQLYWAILETWSTQVDSYWTRTNYFAAFEIAAIAGTWVLLGVKDLTLGHLCVALAGLLTAAWIYSNLRSHAYVQYWWDVLKDIEARTEWLTKPNYISGYEERRKESTLPRWLPYSRFTNWVVPLFFFGVWVLLIWMNWSGIPQQVPAEFSGH
jgi:hypothetical protein